MLSLDDLGSDFISNSYVYAIDAATSLESLSLRSQALTSLGAIPQLPHLRYLHLDNNRLTDVGPLIGETRLVSPSPNNATPWQRSLKNVSGADEGDYLWTQANEFSGAAWTYQGADAGTYEVWTTWLPNEDRTTAANYKVQILDTDSINQLAFTTTVNQRFAPVGEVLDRSCPTGRWLWIQFPRSCVGVWLATKLRRPHRGSSAGWLLCELRR